MKNVTIKQNDMLHDNMLLLGEIDTLISIGDIEYFLYSTRIGESLSTEYSESYPFKFRSLPKTIESMTPKNITIVCMTSVQITAFIPP